MEYEIKARLIFLHLTTTDAARSLKFYETLFSGPPFARSLTHEVRHFHVPILREGVHFHIAEWKEIRQPIIPYFSVESLPDAVDRVGAAGGAVLATYELKMSPEMFRVFTRSSPTAALGEKMGDCATIEDPQGTLLGLIQLTPLYREYLSMAEFPYRLGPTITQMHEAALSTALEAFPDDDDDRIAVD